MTFSYKDTRSDTGGARKAFTVISVVYFICVLLAILYVCFVARDRYVSNATFKITKEQSSGGLESGLDELGLSGVSDSGSADSQITIGYIHSTDLLLHLEDKFNLVDHYSSPSFDLVFRMEKDASLESRLSHYRKRIFAYYDKDTGLTLLEVDSYDPELSQQIAEEVLLKAETFVNGIDQHIAEKQASFVQRELDVAQKKVIETHKELLELQNKHQLINPDEVVSARLAALQEMQVEKLRAEAELASLTRDSPESPAIGTLQSKLKSLSELIDTKMSELSGPERDRMNQIIMDFKDLNLKLDFATRMRTSAEMLLEKNRVNAYANTRFFSVIQSPHRPEEAVLPNRDYVSVTIAVIALLSFLIVRALAFSSLDRI